MNIGTFHVLLILILTVVLLAICRIKPIALLIGILMASGCEGGPQPGQSKVYLAINEALIENGACYSQADCEKRQLVFWQGGRNRVYFSIYSASDPSLRVRVERAVMRAKTVYRVPYPIELQFHTESKVEATRRIIPRRASYIKEIR